MSKEATARMRRAVADRLLHPEFGARRDHRPLGGNLVARAVGPVVAAPVPVISHRQHTGAASQRFRRRAIRAISTEPLGRDRRGMALASPPEAGLFPRSWLSACLVAGSQPTQC